jgi:hypothetical protein
VETRYKHVKDLASLKKGIKRSRQYRLFLCVPGMGNNLVGKFTTGLAVETVSKGKGVQGDTDKEIIILWE